VSISQPALQETYAAPAREAPSQTSPALSFLRKGTWLIVVGMALGNIAPALVILLARVFPPATFGLYVSLQALVLTVSKLTTLGLDRGLNWYVARERARPARRASALVAATWVALALALVVVLGGALLCVLAPELGQALLHGDLAFAAVCLLALPGWCVLHLHAGALEGLLKPGYRIFLNQTLVTTLAPALGLLLYALGLGRWGLAVGLVLANTLGAALIVWAARRALPELRYLQWPGIERRLLAYSWPLGLGDFLTAVLLRTELWMLLVLLGPDQAAIYAVMSTLAGGVRAVRQSYDPLLVPVVSALPEQGSRELGRVFRYAVHMVSSLQLVLAAGIVLFARELLSLAGRHYAEQSQVLAILLVTHLLQGFLGMAGTVVLGLGKTRPLLALNVATLLLNIGLNALWIPRAGPLGAAWAAATTVLLTGVIVVVLQARLTRAWLFSRRLWGNAALVLLLMIGVVIDPMPSRHIALEWRGGLALGVLALVALNAWLSREQRPGTPRAAPGV
jgi:O-antigen/teichoic acid export membrane protein